MTKSGPSVTVPSAPKPIKSKWEGEDEENDQVVVSFPPYFTFSSAICKNFNALLYD